MKITFNVPQELEETFIGRSQGEIDLLLTQAFKNTDIRLVQNLCFDILSKVANISSAPIATTTNTEQVIPHSIDNNQTKLITVSTAEKDIVDKKLSDEVENKPVAIASTGRRKRRSSIVK